MNMQQNAANIRVLIADDDECVLDSYRHAFCDTPAKEGLRALDALEAELFDRAPTLQEAPGFDIVSCSQGDEAVALASKAADDGLPFDVVILDVRMPPGIDGVETGQRIRTLDPDVEIIFVTGFSDVPRDELERRVPPPMKLHYFNKPLSFARLAQDVAGMVRAH